MLKMNDIIAVRKNMGGDRDIFKISWKLTNWCNYRCPYCYMSDKVKTYKNEPFDKILKIADNLDELILKQARNKRVLLHLIGGEVSYYDLKQIFERIKAPNFKEVLIVTNLSRDLSYWEDLRDYCKSRKIKFTVNASFHLSQCKPEEFVKKASVLKCKIKCVIDDSNVNEYKSYLVQLKEAGCKVMPTITRGVGNITSNVSKETKEFVDYLNNDLRKDPSYFEVETNDGIVRFASNIELINNIEGGGFDPEGFLCSAGLDGVRIDIDGTLRRAGCQFCAKKDQQLGSILENNYTLPTEGVICHTTITLADGTVRHKFCTAFGNTSMKRIQ